MIRFIIRQQVILWMHNSSLWSSTPVEVKTNENTYTVLINMTNEQNYSVFGLWALEQRQACIFLGTRFTPSTLLCNDQYDKKVIEPSNIILWEAINPSFSMNKPYQESWIGNIALEYSAVIFHSIWYYLHCYRYSIWGLIVCLPGYP